MPLSGVPCTPKVWSLENYFTIFTLNFQFTITTEPNIHVQMDLIWFYILQRSIIPGIGSVQYRNLEVIHPDSFQKGQALCAPVRFLSFNCLAAEPPALRRFLSASADPGDREKKKRRKEPRTRLPDSLDTTGSPFPGKLEQLSRAAWAVWDCSLECSPWWTILISSCRARLPLENFSESLLGYNTAMQALPAIFMSLSSSRAST